MLLLIQYMSLGEHTILAVNRNTLEVTGFQGTQNVKSPA